MILSTRRRIEACIGLGFAVVVFGAIFLTKQLTAKDEDPAKVVLRSYVALRRANAKTYQGCFTPEAWRKISLLVNVSGLNGKGMPEIKNVKVVSCQVSGGTARVTVAISASGVDAEETHVLQHTEHGWRIE